MSKQNLTIIAIVFLVLVVGTIWAFRGRADAQVERVKQMQDQLFAGGPPKPEDRNLMREEMRKLNPEQRQAVREHMQENFQRRMDEQIDDYFKLPPEKRVEHLDKQIQEQERRRKEWESRRGQQPRGPGGANASAGGPGQGGPTQVGAGRPPGGGRNASPEARSANRNSRLDRSTPEQRAKRSAYFADLQKRRIALGLPASPGHGHGGHPHGR